MFCFKTEIISIVSACLIARKYLLSNKNQEYFALFHRNDLITDVFYNHWVFRKFSIEL